MKCVSCKGVKPSTGYKTCQRCRDQARNRYRERYHRLKAEGLCVSCGRRWQYSSGRCFFCYERHLLDAQERRERRVQAN